MKKLILITLILIINLFTFSSAKTLSDYKKMPYIGTELTKAVNGQLPFVLIIADPNNHFAIIRYYSIGKMVYREFENKYDFCILNANIQENQEYIEFFKAKDLPAIYIVTPKQNTFARIDKKYHNTNDIRRILNNVLESTNDINYNN